MYYTDGPFPTKDVRVSHSINIFIECQVLPRDTFESYLKNIFGNLYSLSDLDTSRYSDNADIYTDDDPDVLYYPGGFENNYTRSAFSILSISDASEEGIYTIYVRCEYEEDGNTFAQYLIFYVSENEVSDYGYAIVDVEQPESSQ